MSMRRCRNYLINRRLQFGLTLRFLVLTVLFSLFIAFEVYITVWPVVTGYIPEDLIALVRSQIAYRLLFFILPAIFVITGMSLVFTHRIAGPLHRLESVLDRVIRGEEVGPLTLRKGDELMGLGDKINILIGKLRDPS